MGKSQSKQHGGVITPDTILTSDKEGLKSMKIQIYHITQIRVWHNVHINSFECYYGNVSAGLRIGRDYQEGTCYDVTLSPHEHIVLISGTYTFAIDTLCFHTNRGRKLKVYIEVRNQGKLFFLLVIHFFMLLAFMLLVPRRREEWDL